MKTRRLILNIIFQILESQTDINAQDFEIWNGNGDKAQVVNNAGQWSSSYRIGNMFDSNPKTCWHSARNRANELKIIGVQFKVSFEFKRESMK